MTATSTEDLETAFQGIKKAIRQCEDGDAGYLATFDVIRELIENAESELPLYAKGEKPPTGYLAWHQWAKDQVKHGLKQSKCACCAKYLFPQEQSGHRF